MLRVTASKPCAYFTATPVFFAWLPQQRPPPRAAGRLPDSSEKDGVQRRFPHDGGGLQEIFSVCDDECVLGGKERDGPERATRAGGGDVCWVLTATQQLLLLFES